MLPWASFSRKTAIPKNNNTKTKKKKKKRKKEEPKTKIIKERRQNYINIYISYLLKSTVITETS
jgi:hypothetical protein